MKNRTLMQAITRANRVHEDKQVGFTRLAQVR